MNAPSRKHWSPPVYQRGVAAVELAILAMVMFFFLTAPLLIAHSVMQATLAQRAAFNATHMLATYPQYLRLDPDYPPLEQSEAMLVDALDAAGLGPISPGDIDPSCSSSANCKQTNSPTEISITVPVNVLSPISVIGSATPVQLSITAADRYTN